MPPEKLRACANCRLLTTEERCPMCGVKTSNDWSGYLVVINPKKSEIAARANIKVKGRYALKVR